MLDLLIQILLIFFTYFLTPILLLLPCLRIVKFQNTEDAYQFLWILMGLGPFVVSLLLNLSLAIVPGLPQNFYLIVVSSALLMLPVFFNKELGQFSQLLTSFFQDIRSLWPSSWLDRLAIASVILVVSLLYFANMAFPMTGNDPLEYAQTARILADLKSSDAYPILNSDQANGYYGPWSHPMGYVLLLVWNYFIQGSTEYAGWIKFVAPTFSLYSVLLIFSLTRGLPIWLRAIGVHFLISIPMYYAQASISHIDPIRIHGFLVAIVLFWKLLQNPSFALAGLFTFGVGFALYTHSIGILIIPIILGLCLLLWFLKIRNSLVFVVPALFAGLIFVIPQYVDNIRNFGSVVADAGAVPVYELKELGYKDYFRVTREIGEPFQRVVRGALKGFTKTESFGYSYWAFLLMFLSGLFFILRKSSRIKSWLNFKLDLLSLSILVVVGYLFGAVLSTIIGTDALIKNDRYMMTSQPFVSLSIILIAGALFSKFNWQPRSRVLKGLIVLVLAYLCYLPSYRTAYETYSARLSPLTLFDSDLEKLYSYRSGIYRSVLFVKDETAKDAKILNFRQSDFSYYGQREFVSHLDPKIKELYSIQSVDRAFDYLKEQGVTHIATPGYAEPAFYNSVVSKLVGNSAFAKLLLDEYGYRIFQLLDESQTGNNDNQLLVFEWNEGVNSVVWTEFSNVDYYKGSKDNYLSTNFNSTDNRSLSNRVELFRYSGKGLINSVPSQAFSNEFSIEGGMIHSGEFSIEGNGLSRVYLIEFTKTGLNRYSLIWEGTVSKKRDVLFQLAPIPSTKEFRVAVSSVGKSEIQLKSFKLFNTQERYSNRRTESWDAELQGWRAQAHWQVPENIRWGQSDMGIYLKIVDGRKSFLYSPRIDFRTDKNYRVRGKIKGTGQVQLGLYDSKEDKNFYIHDLFLDENFGTFTFETMSGLRRFIEEGKLDPKQFNSTRIAIGPKGDPIRREKPKVTISNLVVEEELEDGSYKRIYEYSL